MTFDIQWFGVIMFSFILLSCDARIRFEIFQIILSGEMTLNRIKSTSNRQNSQNPFNKKSTLQFDTILEIVGAA